MKLDNMLPFRRHLWLGIALLSVLSRADDLSQSYCSTENTGADFSAISNIYQSLGACQQSCIGGGYAFAVVQYQDCWCSNYIPAQQASVDSNCNVNCPGYPLEQCGDADNGYYGYLALGPSPSGTAGFGAQADNLDPSSAAPSFSEEHDTSFTSALSSSTTTVITPASTTTSNTPSSTTTFSITSTTDHTPTTPAPVTPVTSIIVETVSGNIVTQTVTSVPTIVSDTNPSALSVQHQGGVPAGTVAGVVIGVVAGLALLALAAFLLWRRKQKSHDTENNAGSTHGSAKSMKRNVSVLSKAGLLNRTQPSMGEREHDESYYANATAGGGQSVRHSMMIGSADGVSPTSPLDSSHSDSSRRHSKPMVYDQRLNPSALFASQEANGSRISMQDTEDYSRPLGVMNPDPRASFESRMSHA